MQTYWDLTEKERAALDRAGVERYIDAELMTKGCLRPVEPRYEDVPAEPEIATQRYYAIEYHRGYERKSELLYLTTEAAEAALKTAIAVYDNKALGGYGHGYRDCAASIAKGKLIPHDLPTAASLDARLPLLEKIAAAEAANAARKKEYEQAVQDQNDALVGLWGDWTECCATAEKNTKVRDTFQKYTQIAEGDTATARRFLGQAFDVVQISNAEEWFGETFGPVYADELEQTG